MAVDGRSDGGRLCAGDGLLNSWARQHRQFAHLLFVDEKSGDDNQCARLFGYVLEVIELGKRARHEGRRHCVVDEVGSALRRRQQC